MNLAWDDALWAAAALSVPAGRLATQVRAPSRKLLTGDTNESISAASTACTAPVNSVRRSASGACGEP